MMTSTTCGSELQPSSLDCCHSIPSSLHPHHHHHQPLLRRCNSNSNFLLPPPWPQTNTFLSADHSPNLNPPNETTSSPSPTHFNSSLPPPLPLPQQPPTSGRFISDLNPSPAPTDTDATISNEISVKTDTDTPNSKQPPALRCSVSDLNPSLAQAFSRSSNSNEMSIKIDTDTPNSKRLKRMKGGLKEMMCEEDLEHDEELKIVPLKICLTLMAVKIFPMIFLLRHKVHHA